VVVAAVVIGLVAREVTEPDASPAAGPTASADAGFASATAAQTASPQASTAAFPTDAEERLLARLDATVARHCQRADPADVPELEEEDSLVFLLAHDAGLECRLGSTSEPDTVWYWSAVPGQRLEQVSNIFFQTVGRRRIPPGDCATSDYAYGPWEFGATTGDLLCYGSRNATMMWTYDDENILATAVRSDGDMRALYSWWRDHARILGS
jgi:hypothetical protein